MAEDIVVRYRAEVDELTRQLKLVADRMDALEKESKQSAEGIAKLDVESKKFAADLGKIGTGLDSGKKKVKSFADSTKKEFSGLSKEIKSIGANIAAGIAAAFSVRAVINFAQASIDAFARFETVAKSFKVFLGDADRAKEVLAELEEFSIRTPFTPEEVQNAGRALLAFGIEARNLVPTLENIGNIAAGTGKNFGELAVIFGKARTQGVLFAEDINQLTEAGVPIIQEFAKQFGVAESEVKKLGSQGKITFANLEEGFKSLTSEGGKFNGLIAELGTTTAGQLSTIEGEVIAIQRSIGEQLAPFLIKARRYVVDLFREAINLTRFLTGNAESTTDQLDAIFQNRERQRREEIVLADLAAKAQVNGLTLIENAQKELLETGQLLLQNRKEIVAAELKDNQAVVRTLEFRRDRLTQEAGILTDIINGEKERLKLEEESRIKLEEQRKAQQALLNAQEFEKRKKLFDEFNKDIRQIDAEATKAEKEEQRKRDTEFFESLEARRKAREEYNAETERLQREAFERETAALPEDLKRAVANQFVINQKELEAEAIKQINLDEKLDYEQRQAEILRIAEATTKQISDFYAAIGLDFEEKNEKEAESWITKNQEILDSSVALLTTLGQLYNNFYDARILQINRERDAQLEALDIREDAVNDNLKKRRISEAEAEAQFEQIRKKRTETEKKAADEERRIKRKQFQIDQAAAIIEIAISTAKAVAESLTVPALAALYAALGAAQGALVASQPNPYRKGSKNTKEGLARVGEEGEEIVFMPGGSKVLPAKQTKTYGQVLDAMFDNKFEKYVMTHYVTPALQKQQRTYESNRQATFANKVGESIVLNTTGMTAQEMERIRKRGHVILNADEIGRSVANHIKSDPYRL